MRGLGSGDNGEFTFLDFINIVSFYIGLQNLDLNLTQDSLDKQTMELDARVNKEINDALEIIQSHLQKQDAKIDLMMKKLEVKENERL